MEKEKLLLEYLQPTNTGDGGKVGIWAGISGFGTRTTKIYTENMDSKFYCDVVQHQLKSLIVQMTKKIKFFFQQDLAP